MRRCIGERWLKNLSFELQVYNVVKSSYTCIVASSTLKHQNKDKKMKTNSHFQLWLANNRRGITATDIAKQIGVSRVMVSRWLNGHSRPNLDNFFALCQFIALDSDHADHLLNMGLRSMVCDIKFKRMKEAGLCSK